MSRPSLPVDDWGVGLLTPFDAQLSPGCARIAAACCHCCGWRHPSAPAPVDPAKGDALLMRMFETKGLPMVNEPADPVASPPSSLPATLG